LNSGGIDEDELCILHCRDGEFGFVDGGDAVTDRNPLPIDKDHALGRGEIGVPQARRWRVGKSGPGKQRSAQDSRIGADRERFRVLRFSARELNEASGAIPFGEFAAVPTGLPAAVTWKQPYLEKLEGVFVSIVFGMADPRSSTHDLDIAGNGPTDVAGAIFMRDRALPNIGDDFHVGVSVAAEAGAGRDFVVVPDYESSKGAIRGIALGRNDEMVARLQPATVAVVECLFGSKLQHDRSSIADAVDIRFENGYGAETIEGLVGKLRTGRSIW